MTAPQSVTVGVSSPSTVPERPTIKCERCGEETARAQYKLRGWWECSRCERQFFGPWHEYGCRTPDPSPSSPPSQPQPKPESDWRSRCKIVPCGDGFDVHSPSGSHYLAGTQWTPFTELTAKLSTPIFVSHFSACVALTDVHTVPPPDSSPSTDKPKDHVPGVGKMAEPQSQSGEVQTDLYASIERVEKAIFEYRSLVASPSPSPEKAQAGKVPEPQAPATGDWLPEGMNRLAAKGNDSSVDWVRERDNQWRAYCDRLRSDLAARDKTIEELKSRNVILEMNAESDRKRLVFKQSQIDAMQ